MVAASLSEGEMVMMRVMTRVMTRFMERVVGVTFLINGASELERR